MTDPVPDLSALVRPERLAALERSGLLDSPADEAFDRVTRIATRHLGTPVALASIVDDHRQFFKSAIGLPEPWASARETPLTHSFCQYVVASGQPLVVSNAREHDLVRDNLAIDDLDVIAYAGVPIVGADGELLGSLCAIDGKERTWGEDDIAILTDLAEMLRAELRLRQALGRAEELEAARTDMLAVLGHDLRGPLTVVGGLARTMADHWGRFDDDRRMEFAEMISSQSQRANEMVTRLLAKEGRIPEPELSVVDLRAELLHHAHSSELSTPERALVGVEGEPVPAMADAMMLRQIVGNLVNNAFEHGGEEVAVTLDAGQEGGRVVLEVTDDGPGIAPEDLERIFERFAGRRSSTNHGLGLHIVRRFARAMGGDVEVASELGKGATFRVTLAAG